MRAIVGLVAVLAVMAGTIMGTAQVVHAETIAFSVQAAGANEVPPVTSGGTASAQFTFNTETNELVYILTVRGIAQDQVTAAHIHQGTAGENGPVIHTLADEGFLQITGSVNLSDEEVEALFAGGLYLNVHSEEHPDGFARGQLTPPQPSQTAETTPTVEATPAETETVISSDAISPPSTGDAGIRDRDSAGWLLPIAALLALASAGSALLLRSRA